MRVAIAPPPPANRSRCTRRAALVVVVAAVLATAPSPVVAQSQPASPLAVTLASELQWAVRGQKRHVVAVQCDSGGLLVFDPRAADSVSDIFVRIKKRFLVARVEDVATLTDSVALDAARDLAHAALANGSVGRVVRGNVAASVTTPGQPFGCRVIRVLTPRQDWPAFEDGILLRRAGMNGDAIGWAIYDYVKPKPKGNSPGCQLEMRVGSAPGEVPDSVARPFREAVEARIAENNRKAGVATPAVAGHRLTVDYSGFIQIPSIFVGFGRISVIGAYTTFVVTDAASGRLLLRGRALRAIGGKVESDIRELASYVSCG